MPEEMKPVVIRFSHRYQKLVRDFENSLLLDVVPIKLEEMSEEFRKYDTTYIDNGKEKQYPLPEKGNFMVLMLLAGSGKGQLWTTIRSQKGRGGLDKLQFYKGKIGEICECQII